MEPQDKSITMPEILKTKSIERLKAAQLCYENQHFHACASNLYFAIFNYMQSVLGDPPKGKWKHMGIERSFGHFAYKNALFENQVLKQISLSYDLLYDYRIEADYKGIILSDGKIKELKDQIDFITKVLL